jgi:putative iron-dependent peroxidase
MSVAQPGIFAFGTRSHYYLEFDLLPDADLGAVFEALGALREPPVTAGGANLVIGLGAELWRRMAPGAAPAEAKRFPGVSGANGRGIPSTQHDIWLWVHGTGEDVLVDIARAASMRLAKVARVAASLPAFVYQDSRDMTGFIDGTENPPVWEAPEVALIPHGEVGASGSHVIAIKWVHALGAFHELDEHEQEGVIGRTKPDSVELDEDTKPPTAHISRVVVNDEHGEELEIFRRSTPFGSVDEQGLYFVAFSAELSRFEIMLQRMFGLTDDGLHDRLMDFTRAVSGSYYFVPSIDDLFGS